MSLTDGFNDRQAIIVIRDSLQTNLTDPREQWTNSDRNWIHTDNPLASSTYPRIQVRKRGPTNTEIISEGKEFVEWRSLVLDIQFWTSSDFKWKQADNTYLVREELVEEWLDRIWVTLKAQQATLQSTYGITGLKPITEDDPYLEPDTQLFTGIISIRVWYFRK